MLLCLNNTLFPGGASGKESLCWRYETWVRSLGWKEPPEKEMATHSSILAWRIPWTEEPGRLWSIDLQRVGYDWSDLAKHKGFLMISLWSQTKDAKDLVIEKWGSEGLNESNCLTRGWWRGFSRAFIWGKEHFPVIATALPSGSWHCSYAQNRSIPCYS